jgi:hypothetical protein
VHGVCFRFVLNGEIVSESLTGRGKEANWAAARGTFLERRAVAAEAEATRELRFYLVLSSQGAPCRLSICQSPCGWPFSPLLAVLAAG